MTSLSKDNDPTESGSTTVGGGNGKGYLKKTLDMDCLKNELMKQIGMEIE